MKIEHLHIDGFGCHQNLDLTFRDGLNILRGKNESGKTTVLAFIRAVLYGFETAPESEEQARISLRKNWIPWQGGTFGGSLTFTERGKSVTVTAIWGFTPEEDQIFYQEEGDIQKTALPHGHTIGETWLQLPAERFDRLALCRSGRNAAGTDIQEPELQTLESLLQNSRLPLNGTAVSSSDKEDFTPETRLENVRMRLDHAMPQEEKATEAETLQQLRQTEEDALHLTERIAEAENERAELLKKDIQPQSLDALKASVTLLEQQKRVHTLKNSIEEQLSEHDAEALRLKRKKLPWTILLIVLCILDLAFLAYLLLPDRLLNPILPQSVLRVGIRTAPAVSVPLLAGILFFVLTLILMILRIAGKGTLYELEENIEYKKQALADQLGLPDCRNEQALLQATEELDERCTHADHCLAAIDRDRLEKAALNEKLEELNRRITYDRAQSETIYQMLSRQESCAEHEDRLAKLEKKDQKYRKHQDALRLCLSLLNDARKKQQNDLLPRLSEASGALLSDFTAGKYNSVEFNGALLPSIANYGVSRSGIYYRGATAAQISLALRISENQLLAEGGLELPLLLDEPFAQYDESHCATTLQALRNYAEKHQMQIIVTTCRADVAENQYALSI